jgi:hypothetical protein
MSDHLKFFSTHFPYRVRTHSRLELIRKELAAIAASEETADIYDYDPHLISAVEEALAALDEYLDYDPTPQYAEEPGITMAEMHTAAWQQHQALHS